MIEVVVGSLVHRNDNIFVMKRGKIYKYILLVRVICEKYRLRGEANIPSRFISEGFKSRLKIK
jgi:hypothetical protein